MPGGKRKRHWVSRTLVRAPWVLALAFVGCSGLEPDRSQSGKPPEPPPTIPSDVVSQLHWQQLERSLQDRLFANPEDAAAYGELGKVYHKQRLYAASQSAFKRAVERDPKNAELRFAYANMLAESGADSEAYRQVESALEIEASGDSYALLGVLLRRAGRNDEALEAFRKGWESRPPSAAAGYELALWNLTRGDVSAANRQLELCLIYAPSSQEVRELYAETLEKAGRLREAAEQWEKLVAAGKGSGRSHARLAVLYSQLGDPSRASENLEAAQRLTPAGDPMTPRDLLGHNPPVNSEFRPLLPEG